jgi:adapter protein MecA 1/2
MKIEKVNDHQIRCTLTKADLADRELKISELAYGTEKAKSLFRDMMQQASAKFGFEADDIPLMIEAIPLNADCIVLVITKVEDPDEIDPDDFSDSSSDNTDSIFDLFRQIQESRHAQAAGTPTAPASKEDKTTATAEVKQPQEARIFSFPSMHTLLRLSHVVNDFYTGHNTLYRNRKNDSYLLILKMDQTSVKDFNRICNIASEYGRLERSAAGSEAYFKEHYELVTENNALQTLAAI